MNLGLVPLVRAAAAQKALLPEGGLVVLGLSGGPDSVCLFHILCELAKGEKPETPHFHLVCAHVNHGLRGEESDSDEVFVRELCAKNNILVEIGRADTPKIAKDMGASIEEAGRAARYAFFDEICKRKKERLGLQNGVCAIALAHNADDRAETALMRILRGTGTDGLDGVPVKRASEAGFAIVRPLLDISRAEIESYLSENDFEYRIDSTNAETDVFRNRIRNEILPALSEAAGLDVKQSLLRLARNAAEDREYFAVLCEALLNENFKENSLPVDLLMRLHPALRHRLLVRAFARLGLKRDIAAVHLSAADRLLQTAAKGGEATGKRVEFPRDFTFGIEKDKAVLRLPDQRKDEWKPRRK